MVWIQLDVDLKVEVNGKWRGVGFGATRAEARVTFTCVGKQVDRDMVTGCNPPHDMEPEHCVETRPEQPWRRHPHGRRRRQARLAVPVPQGRGLTGINVQNVVWGHFYENPTTAERIKTERHK